MNPAVNIKKKSWDLKNSWTIKKLSFEKKGMLFKQYSAIGDNISPFHQK